MNTSKAVAWVLLFLVSGPIAAPIDFTSLAERSWTIPGEDLGQVYGTSEISWTYDGYHKKFVRFGGCTGGYTNEVYAYSFDGAGKFTSEMILAPGSRGVTDTLRPGAGCTRGICYDSKRHIVWGLGGIGSPPITCTGKNRALIGLDLSDSSFRMAPGSDLGFHIEVAQIEYSAHHDAIIWVGRDGSGWQQTRLYEFSKSAWRQIGAQWSPSAPGPRTGLYFNYLHLAYDTLNHLFVILMAGPKTWVFDPATMTDWEVRTPSPSPPFRNRYGMAYDPVRQRVILHAGYGGDYSNRLPMTDTWAYDAAANTWTQIATTGAFSSSNTEFMPFDYDSEHDVFVGYYYGSSTSQVVAVFKNGPNIPSAVSLAPAPKALFPVIPNPIRSFSELLRDPGWTAAGKGVFTLYSSQGRLIEQSDAGFSGTDNHPAGIYFLQADIDGRKMMKKVALVR